ncbi:hypothetical protein E2C01_043708 [Portunus trituberculatus]|uniref:Uncharacterized protein n=1 Tax=Portunus trituberculatus TaxID=210409 RepID=A0A5B7G099_PORTR|nr:hypothetical protein [Portunus trituberculatus]
MLSVQFLSTNYEPNHGIKFHSSAPWRWSLHPRTTATTTTTTSTTTTTTTASLQEVLCPSHPTQASLPSSLRARVRTQIPVEAAGGNSPSASRPDAQTLPHIMHKSSFISTQTWPRPCRRLGAGQRESPVLFPTGGEPSTCQLVSGQGRSRRCEAAADHPIPAPHTSTPGIPVAPTPSYPPLPAR